MSTLCGEVDVKVEALFDRLIEGEWPYIWIEATYLKVRRGGRIVSGAAIIAVGVDANRPQEVSGLEIVEAEQIWQRFCES